MIVYGQLCADSPAPQPLSPDMAQRSSPAGHTKFTHRSLADILSATKQESGVAAKFVSCAQKQRGNLFPAGADYSGRETSGSDEVWRMGGEVRSWGGKLGEGAGGRVEAGVQ